MGEKSRVPFGTDGLMDAMAQRYNFVRTGFVHSMGFSSGVIDLTSLKQKNPVNTGYIWSDEHANPNAPVYYPVI